MLGCFSFNWRKVRSSIFEKGATWFREKAVRPMAAWCGASAPCKRHHICSIVRPFFRLNVKARFKARLLQEAKNNLAC
jgi:hypothetical protein